MEKIEVAVRTQLSLVYSVSSQDVMWYLDSQQYGNTPDDTFTQLQEDIEDDVNRSNEDFIKHYYVKYDSPTMPPSWMSLEVLSFGTLSRMYKLLKRSDDKKKVAHAFGIGDIISPGNSFKNKLKELLEGNHRLLTLKDMGFPVEWEELPVWKA